MTALLLILTLFLFCSCSNSVSYEPYTDVRSELDSHTDMVLLHSAGIDAYVGTNKSGTKPNETPKMRVSFDYDFSIARHETTCSEFNSLMDLQVKCENKKFPATSVTYYDAVLFANARSISENKDTAYTYTGITLDNNGHCISLNGFAFHPEAEAYRLPTEAEWTLAALQGWNPGNGWSAEKASYTIQKICTSTANSAGICDMEGNVKEWVNDWLGLFRDTTVTDFLGAPDGGGIGERVVKGGSYKDPEATINLYSRGDVYLVTSSNKADYIGFRLAYGAIPHPSWIDRKGELNENPVDVLATSATLRSLTQKSKSKLVFRNDVTGNLVIIDYTSSPALVSEIKDSLDVYHPDVSPDGNWVAFCTKVEGQSGKSSVYVRSMNDLEAPAIRLDAKSAAIPRWRVLKSGDTVITYVTDAGNNQDDSEFFSRSTWQVQFAGEKFGAPQKIFDGAYHGGMNESGNFSVTGSRLFRVRIQKNTKDSGPLVTDTVWYGGNQVCNVSLSKDGVNKTVFLDFGGKAGQEFVGKSYGPHERLFIANRSGYLIQSIAAPAGYTFDHTEWAGDGIIATLTNSNGAHTTIVYINTADSSITELVKGEELWHPCLWTKNKTFLTNKSVLDLDSAGIYYSENAKICVFELREKMEKFWTQKDSVSVVAFGSSRALSGLTPQEMKSENMLNFAYSGGDLFGTEYLFKNYVLNHVKNLKFIVVEITPNMFWRTPEQDWFDIYNTNLGLHYDENHDFWKENIPDGFIDAVVDGPTLTSTQTLPYRDDFSLPTDSWGIALVACDSTEMEYGNEVMKVNFAHLERIVKMANEAGVKVIALNFPVNPGYAETGTSGPYGPARSIAKKVLKKIAALDVVLMDENKWGEHDYTDDMAYDPDHLSYEGALQLTHRLDSLLQTLK